MGNLAGTGLLSTPQHRVSAKIAEMRAAPRYTMLIRAAKLITRRGEFLCVIRDVSETGVSMRIFHPLPACRTMAVELQNGDRHNLELVWQDDERAGFRFSGKSDISRIIECPSEFTRRPVRINLAAPAMVEVSGQAEHATIQDISQQGAKIACAVSFAIDQRIRLMADGMRDTIAKIRWRREGTLGLVFEETFQYGELARVVRHLQGVP